MPFQMRDTDITKKRFPDLDAYIEENYEDELIKHQMEEFICCKAEMDFEPSMQDECVIELKECCVKRSFDDVIAQASETFQQRLMRLLAESGMGNVEFYEKSNIGKKNFSKIKNNENYTPKKETAFAIALALELNLDETKDLLARAGYAISPSSKFDLAIQYFIEHEEYDLFTIDEVLYEHDMPLLGNYE